MKTKYLDTTLNDKEWKWARFRHYCRSVEVNVAQHCNLNCAGCTHYSPISKKIFLDVKSYEKDINRLSKIFPSPYLREVRLLGGEPLLHPQLEQIISITRKAYPTARIDIVSNGILVKKMPQSFFKCLRQNNARFAYTEYPIDTDYREVEEILRSNKIDYRNYNDDLRDEFRYDLLDPSGKYDAKKNFMKCRNNYCLQLVDGKIFICPYNAFCEKLNEKFLQQSTNQFEISQRDYLDIYKSHTPFSIMRFVLSHKNFCKYCALDKAKSYPWKRTNFSSSEWIVE